VAVEGDQAGRGESQGQAVCQREPIPVLGEDQNADDGEHVGVAGAGLQGDAHVAATSVDDALGEDGSEFGHDVFVLVDDHFGVESAEFLDFGRGVFGVLDEHHGGSDEGALANEVDGVVGHRFDEGERFLEAGAGARDAKSHGSAVADVRVVALGEKGHHTRALLRSPETKK